MTKHFTEQFDGYAIAGEYITCTVGDTTYTATLERDDDASIDDDDCHNTDQSVTGCDDEQHARLMQARQDYCDGKWWYGGIVLSAERDGWVKDHMQSLWGIEVNYPDGDNNYLTEVANEILAEYLREEELKSA